MFLEPDLARFFEAVRTGAELGTVVNRGATTGATARAVVVCLCFLGATIALFLIGLVGATADTLAILAAFCLSLLTLFCYLRTVASLFFALLT